jgi:lipoprotein-anchoring transpeptidase ErfK/SrfK
MFAFFRKFEHSMHFIFVLTIFISSSAIAQENVIIVSFSQAVLSFYSGDALIAEFPVVVPLRAEEPRRLPVYGVVRKVERNPSWYPTQRTKAYFLEKRKIVLPKVVFPDNPLNPLGTVKVIVDWHDPNKPTARIHGTNEPILLSLPSEKRHRSGGCIRLLNKDAEKLAMLIQSGAGMTQVLYTR